MARTAIVGGGPAGLSAALFLAKNGEEAVVFDTDKTWMHKAHLFNYLGIESMDGSEYLDAAREQVDGFGAERHDEAVSSVETDGDGFEVTTESGDVHAVDYVVLATGAKRDLAEDLGCDFADGVVDVEVTMETSVADAYATGAMVRAEEWQAIISAGDGAAAALNVLTKEKGEHFHDFDTPADAE